MVICKVLPHLINVHKQNKSLLNITKQIKWQINQRKILLTFMKLYHNYGYIRTKLFKNFEKLETKCAIELSYTGRMINLTRKSLIGVLGLFL